MRLLIVSDTPSAPTSWGQWTRQLVPRLQAAGHECMVYATTYHGEQMVYQGMTLIGGNGDVRGDLMSEYAHRFNADAILTLKDPYVYAVHVARNLSVPWIAVVPVDTEPVSAWVAERINFATARLAITRNGCDLLAQRGITAHYTPLGIDTAFWCPGDREEARDALNLPREAFVAAFVGANQTRPSRKAIEQILLAWAQFLYRFKDTHPDAILYLHTRLGVEFGGQNLDAMIKAFDIPARNWRCVDQIAYQGGYVPREQVRDVYRAANVLLSPSTGEGFCFPLVEAQSCGTPGIGLDWTAMRDTLWSGWKIPRDHCELEWEPSNGFRLRVHTNALEYAIGQAATVDTKTADQLAALAREGALHYELKHVIAQHWLPALNTIQQLIIEGIVDDGPVTHHARTMEPARETGCNASCVKPQAPALVGGG